MLPLVRIFTRGPKAAFERSRERAKEAVAMQNLNASRFPGGRRLSSNEIIEITEGTLRDSTEPRNGGNSTIEADAVPIGGKIIPWDSEGGIRTRSRTRLLVAQQMKLRICRLKYG